MSVTISTQAAITAQRVLAGEAGSLLRMRTRNESWQVLAERVVDAYLAMGDPLGRYAAVDQLQDELDRARATEPSTGA